MNVSYGLTSIEGQSAASLFKEQFKLYDSKVAAYMKQLKELNSTSLSSDRKVTMDLVSNFIAQLKNDPILKLFPGMGLIILTEAEELLSFEQSMNNLEEKIK